MKIAVDVNGGDRSPGEITDGVLSFAKDHPDCGLILCADRETAGTISSVTTLPNIELESFEHSVGMKDTPAVSKKDKSDNTIAGAVNAVKAGRADCAFSCGNSGAVILSSADILGLKDKNFSPALLSFIPVYKRRPLAMFDVGALGNHEFKADLYFFHITEAVNIYVKLYGQKKPVIKLLNIGSEQWKGTAEHKKIFRMLEESSYDFKGNAEGDDILSTEADMIISDGFTGNITLKLLESFNNICKKFNNIKDCQGDENLLDFYSGDFTYESVGAAILLGVNGKILIGHGKSTSKAVVSGLEMCVNYAKL